MGQEINGNNNNSTWMSLLLVPAITIGLSLLGYQTYVWITGKSFKGFSMDIGRLWSSDEIVQKDNIKEVSYSNVIRAQDSSSILNERSDELIIPILKSRKKEVIEEVFEQEIKSTSSKFKTIVNTLDRIDHIDINSLISNNLHSKYINRLKSESLISPDMVPKKGKIYWGINFSPSYSYRTFNIDASKVNGMAEEQNRVYTTGGLTEEKRNSLDKAITSYSFGIDIGKQINDKFSIYSGLHISGYGEQILVTSIDENNPNYCYAEFHDRQPTYCSIEIDENTNNIPFTNRYKYFEIPFGARYTISKFDKAKISLDLGAYYQKVYQVNALLYDFDTDYYYWFNDEDDIINDSGIGVSMGIGLIQNLTERIELTFNPHFKFNLSSTFSDSYSVEQNQYSTGVRVGVRQQIF
jgi:hypothetical protein